jgi:glycosyltransferase involved in cell wall biosynthesis
MEVEQAEPRLMILMAALNEEKGIDLTMKELRKVLGDCRVLVVDGNSSDKTAGVAKNLGAEVVYQKGKGKGDAVAFGLRHLPDGYEYVVLIDADYTYPAEYIPRMVKILQSDSRVGMVCGNRFNSHMHFNVMNDYLYFGNRTIAFVHNFLNGVELKDPLTGLRLVRSDLLKKWQPKSKGFDVEVELNHHVERQGYGIREIDIPYRMRVGEKKLSPVDGMAIMKRILMEALY